MNLLGVDTGGTFTDLVFTNGKTVQIHKVLSTPEAPERAILQGIREMQITLDKDLHVIHGSTVATNAVLEGKGVKTVYITNRGFKDVLTIGRQARRSLYELSPSPDKPPVPGAYCLETGGRISAKGEILEPLTSADIEQLKQALEKLAPEAAAINLLFSYLDPQFEEMIEQACTEYCFVSRSSRVLPVYKEYERGITTWLNAYIGPLMQGYLQRLQKTLENSHLSVMRSAGQTCDVQQAGEEAVHLLLSGPAGGLAAAHYIAQHTGYSKLLTFDMGGTSTDVALYDGAIELTGDGKINHYPVGVPMVNIHTIGAGGGSIAFVDAGGILQVGPASAGAVPGPACYGQGGKQATVTDANLLLGRIPADTVFGDCMQADIAAATEAMETIAKQCNVKSLHDAARGVIDIANEHMTQALRVISLERGFDPREFTLVAFGGAGGLHVCELAESLGVNHIMVPAAAGVLSALGMLVAEPGRQLTQTIGQLLEDLEESQVEKIAQQLIQQGMAKLKAEGHDIAQMTSHTSLHCCYQGQAHTLSVRWQSITDAKTEFENAYQARYGHQLENDVELVNISVGVNLTKQIALPDLQPGNDIGQEMSHDGVMQRDALQIGNTVNGPMSICDAGATVWVANGWQAMLDQAGHLLLTKQ